MPARMEAYAVHNPWPVRVLGLFDLGDRARSVEARTLERLSANRMQGEWLRLDDTELADLLDHLAQVEREPLALDPDWNRLVEAVIDYLEPLG